MRRDNLVKQNSFNTPLLLATGLFLLSVFVIEWIVLRHTNGTISYPLDDTFIHMTIAKNLAFHGNWGVSPSEFGSASSSLFYSAILALLFKIFSAHTIIPLIINCIAGIALLFVIDNWLRRQEINATGRLFILIAVIFFVPLPVMVISGMEHTLQCLFCFLFIVHFSDWLEKIKGAKASEVKLPWSLIGYGILVTTIRYEGIFLVAIVCLLLLFHRKIKASFQLGIMALLPIILFGAYSVSKGSYFLPNSVLLKSDNIQFSFQGIIDFVKTLLLQKLTVINAVTGLPGSFRPGISLLATQQLLMIIPLVYLLFRKNIGLKGPYRTLLIILLGVTLLHLSFATTGWFYRYEAYLFACTIPVIFVMAYKYGRNLFEEKINGLRIIIAFLAFVLLFPVVFRSVAAISKPARACINIYEQQYQMALFLKENYNNDIVAINDIGAISYLTDAKVLDLWGLASIDVAKSKKDNYYTPDFLDSLSKVNNVKIAVVYDTWFSDSLLHRWKKVATWQIQNNVICGSDIVSFYAVSTGSEEGLRKNLQVFQPLLPPTILIKYY